MDAKIFLWCSKAATPHNPDYWALLCEDISGKLVCAIPIASTSTVKRLQRDGVPVKENGHAKS